MPFVRGQACVCAAAAAGGDLAQLLPRPCGQTALR